MGTLTPPKLRGGLEERERLRLHALHAAEVHALERRLHLRVDPRPRFERQV